MQLPVNAVQKLHEHRSSAVPMIVAEDVGVKIALQVLGTDGGVDPVYAPLGVAPEAFDVVSPYSPFGSNK